MITPDNNITIISKNPVHVSVSDEITEENPKINIMLKIFDPTTFPKAISFSFLIEATILVTSSGRDVPTATIVKPTKDSLICNLIAIFEALSTTKSPPKIIAARPMMAKIILLIIGVFFSYFSSSTGGFFFARYIKNKIYPINNNNKIIDSIISILNGVIPKENKIKTKYWGENLNSE